MAIDKIINSIGTNSITQNTVQNTKEKKVDDKNTEKISSDTESSDAVNFSSKAKKLQETEQILRFALEKLEQFDEVRSEKLEDVQDKLNSDFYFTDQVSDKVSENMFSDRVIRESIEKQIKVKEYVDKLKEADAEAIDNTERLSAIKDRAEAGFYNDEEIIEKTADKILSLFT